TKIPHCLRKTSPSPRLGRCSVAALRSVRLDRCERKFQSTANPTKECSHEVRHGENVAIGVGYERYEEAVVGGVKLVILNGAFNPVVVDAGLQPKRHDVPIRLAVLKSYG